MRDSGVGSTAKGSVKQETEKEEPDRRPVSRRVWGARPGTPRLSTVHTEPELLRLPTPSPVARPGPSTPRHLGVTPRVPTLGNSNSKEPWGRTPTWPSPTKDRAHQAEQQQPLQAERPKGRARAGSHLGGFRRSYSAFGRCCLRLLHHFPTPRGPRSWQGCARPGPNTRSPLTQLSSRPSSLPSSRSLPLT